ncbi:FAD-dependent oxidoreductase [Actinomadura sp. 3N508]|uniref:FAD-dependent oxidoreductase n=1 Tax=Actinomadura sp. 3N508 TaxID=3375153 RepID=UPI00379DD31A
MGGASEFDVLVIGAGVVGLTTAITLAESGLRVRIHTADPPDGATSATAGAMWWPYRVEPYERAKEWALKSFDVLADLAASPAVTGVRMADGIEAGRKSYRPPEWASGTGARPCDADELPAGFAEGWRYRLPLLDMPAYLAYLVGRFESAGGVLQVKKHRDIPLAAAPVIVNCTGTGARLLVDDANVVAVRGQVVVMENPGITEFFCEDDDGGTDLVYILPHGRKVILGGTAEPSSWDREPDPDTTRAILERCTAVRPELAGAPFLGQLVGLRPERSTVRLEEEVRRDVAAPHGRLIHNYGHGGGGVTLAWGCAAEVAELVRSAPDLP